MVLVNEWYQKAVYYRFYRLLHKSQRYGDDAASEIQKVRKNVAVHIKEQKFNGKNFIFVIHFLTELKRACDLSRSHEGTAVLLFT